MTPNFDTEVSRHFFEAYAKTFNSDVDSIVKFYTQDSKLTVDGNEFTGAESIFGKLSEIRKQATIEDLPLKKVESPGDDHTYEGVILFRGAESEAVFNFPTSLSVRELQPGQYLISEQTLQLSL